MAVLYFGSFENLTASCVCVNTVKSQYLRKYHKDCSFITNANQMIFLTLTSVEDSTYSATHQDADCHDVSWKSQKVQPEGLIWAACRLGPSMNNTIKYSIKEKKKNHNSCYHPVPHSDCQWTPSNTYFGLFWCIHLWGLETCRLWRFTPQHF